jgi:hypothetical protein
MKRLENIDMSKILFKVTSRSRREKLIETLHNLQEFATNPNYLICLTLDEDDKTCNNPEMRSYLDSHFGFELHTFFGRSKSKIHAINRDLEDFTNWDILVNVSDDQRFTKKGFDNEIRFAFSLFFPDFDGFVHMRDSNHNPIDALCTMSIIGKKYYERDGYIYHPSYQSVYCDNEAQEVAKRRGKYIFIDTILFDHRHPAYGKAQNDPLYLKNESKAVHLKDHRNFQRRQKTGFQP